MSTTTTFPNEESAWKEAFERHLRKKSFEQYKLLLFEFGTSKALQRELLGKILFIDANNANYWADYINFVWEKFHDRKLHLQRLVNKALEILDENQHKHEHAYLTIQLKFVTFKRYVHIITFFFLSNNPQICTDCCSLLYFFWF